MPLVLLYMIQRHVCMFPVDYMYVHNLLTLDELFICLCMPTDSWGDMAYIYTILLLNPSIFKLMNN